MNKKLLVIIIVLAAAAAVAYKMAGETGVEPMSAYEPAQEIAADTSMGSDTMVEAQMPAGDSAAVETMTSPDGTVEATAVEITTPATPAADATVSTPAAATNGTMAAPSTPAATDSMMSTPAATPAQ